MPETAASSRLPAFNHVAMGVSSDLLGEQGRRALETALAVVAAIRQ